MIAERIAATARYLRLTDDDGTMSLANLVVLAALAKLALSPGLGAAELGALLLALVHANVKKLFVYQWTKKRVADADRLQKLEAEVKQLTAIESARQLRSR